MLKRLASTRLVRRGSALGALVVLCAVVSGVSVPAASANGTCGGYTITNTTQTTYGLQERVVIDVWSSSAPSVDGVTWGGTGWTFISSQQLADHSSTTYQASDLGPGTHDMWIKLHNIPLCDIGSFTIVS